MHGKLPPAAAFCTAGLAELTGATLWQPWSVLGINSPGQLVGRAVLVLLLLVLLVLLLLVQEHEHEQQQQQWLRRVLYLWISRRLFCRKPMKLW